MTSNDEFAHKRPGLPSRLLLLRDLKFYLDIFCHGLFTKNW
jgi:hypothetical protein